MISGGSRSPERASGSAADRVEVGEPPGSRLSASLSDYWTVFAIFLTWILLLPRIVPTPILTDRAVFISVAERLVAGDALYAGVWDNKDPLFYFTIALGRWVSPYADIAVEAALILAAGAALYVIGRKSGLRWGVAAYVAFGAGPIVLTSPSYFPGYSNLGGITLALVSLAARYSSHNVLAGVAAGLLLFFKFITFPIALITLALTFRKGSSGKDLKEVVLGFLAAAAATVAFLSVRGEFLPYLSLLWDNVTVRSEDVGGSALGRLAEHLVRTFGNSRGGATLALVILLVAAASLAVRRGQPLSSHMQTTWLCGLGSAVGGLAVVALSGLWGHHSQIMNVSALLLVVVVASQVPRLLLVAAPTVALVMFIVVANLHIGKVERIYGDYYSLEYGRNAVSLLGETPNETQLILDSGPARSFARLGFLNDVGLGAGLREWPMGCPRFYQAEWFPASVFAGQLDCLNEVDLVLIREAGLRENASPVWNDYLVAVQSLLDTEFKCEPVGDGYQICTKTDQLP